jgi:hypothetical protein
MMRSAMKQAGREESYYSDIGLDIKWTGDLVLSITDQGLQIVDDPETADLGPAPEPEASAEEPPRRFERYSLEANVIRAHVIVDPILPPQVGRLTVASVTSMWIKVKSPLPIGTPVFVDWSVLGGLVMTFAGRIVRTAGHGMGVHLLTDDTSWRFRSSFIDLARTQTTTPPTTTVRKTNEAALKAFQESENAVSELAKRWEQIETRLEDDALHQEFIHECIRIKRLEFALERYRHLKQARPDLPAVNGYLQQIGTILTFYTLKRQDPAQVDTKAQKKWIAIALLVVLVISAVVFAQVVISKRTSGGPTHFQQPEGFSPTEEGRTSR